MIVSAYSLPLVRDSPIYSIIVHVIEITDEPRTIRRVIKRVVQLGRSKRRAEAYPPGYVEGLSDARTMLETTLR